MCQAKVILVKNGQESLIMQDIIHFKVEGDRVWLSRLFEEPVEIKAMVVESDFLKHTVTLRSLEEES